MELFVLITPGLAGGTNTSPRDMHINTFARLPAGQGSSESGITHTPFLLPNRAINRRNNCSKVPAKALVKIVSRRLSRDHTNGTLVSSVARVHDRPGKAIQTRF